MKTFFVVLGFLALWTTTVFAKTDTHLGAGPRGTDCVECQSAARQEGALLKEQASLMNAISKLDGDSGSEFPESISEPVDFTKPVLDCYCKPDVSTMQSRYDGAYRAKFAYNAPKCDEADAKKVETDKSHLKLPPVGFELMQEKASPVQKYYEPDFHEGIEGYEDYYAKDQYAHREWDFSMPGRAAGPFGLALVDKPVTEVRDPKTKKLIKRYESTDYRFKNLYFFPRKAVPSIRKESEQLVVTLPTGETATYDAATRRVIGGAFVETAKSNKGFESFRLGKDVQTDKPAEVRRIWPDSDAKYAGKGVWIEAEVTQNNDMRRQGNSVKIRTGSPDPACKTGKDCSECTIPSDLLWTSKFGQKNPNSLNSGWTCFHFNFKTDADFDAFLKQKCKFGLPKI
ncbi:MAG: hypothetical protein HYW49_02655 [Deltaproteobacteria bacterium]|nr:hypothetical protein [Deltaproteobacteria bacterium]